MKMTFQKSSKIFAVVFVLSTLLFQACQQDDDASPPSTNFMGTVELYDEFGIQYPDAAGVSVEVLSQGNSNTFLTGPDGTFSVPYIDSIDWFEMAKEGFGSISYLNPDLSTFQGQKFRLGEKSSMLVDSLVTTQVDCGDLICLGVSFTVDDFFADEVQRRFFQLRLVNSGNMLSRNRFFVFQENGQTAGQNITPLSATRALVEVDHVSLPVPPEVVVPNGVPLEVQLFGATEREYFNYENGVPGTEDVTLSDQFARDTIVLR